MGVRKDTAKDKWLAEFYKDGQRVRKWFFTRGDAMRFFKQNTQTPDEEVVPIAITAEPVNKPSPPLSFFVQEWFDLHGRTLSDGAARLEKLKTLCERLGDPPAAEFTAEDFADYRKLRLQGAFSANKRKPPKEATVNREHAYLRAVFNELRALQKWKGENPLSGVRLFKERDVALAFLYDDEIRRLLAACDESRNRDLGLITRLCLATGARWREAEELTQAQVMPCKVTFVNTKSNRNRTIPISRELYDMLPKRRGRLFGRAYESFEKAVERAGIELPKGQLTHVLRHTFASHFMMNGGNILVLKDILGHSTIEMTMRYAHFAPSHLESAVKLNPLSHLS